MDNCKKILFPYKYNNIEYTLTHPITPYSLYLSEYICDFDKKMILDFGAGSGILSIASCLAGADKVYCLDISPISDLLILINRENFGFSEQIFIFNKNDEIKFDIIISNSASLPTPLINSVPTYMDAGKLGLDMYLSLIKRAHLSLKREGNIIVTKSSLCPTKAFVELFKSYDLSPKLIKKSSCKIKKETEFLIDYFKSIGGEFYIENSSYFEWIELWSISFIGKK